MKRGKLERIASLAKPHDPLVLSDEIWDGVPGAPLRQLSRQPAAGMGRRCGERFVRQMPGEPEPMGGLVRVQPSSSRDVLDKLGLRPGQVVRVVGRGDRQLLGRVRRRIGRSLTRKGLPADLILFWPRTASEVSKTLAFLRPSIFPQGAIWVVTPKRGCRGSNGLPYLGGAELIPLGRAAGLVDNKTCSLSEIESAMRFVWRREDRFGRGKG
jgi:hypothetical protein